MAGNAEKSRKINGLLNNVAKKKAAQNARSRLLSSSARHQAQQRADYVTSNGLDREDSRKSRSELNKAVGENEIRNLKWQSEHGGMVDHIAERAAKRTKAKRDAEFDMKYAEYRQTEDRMKDWKKGADAIDRKGQQQKRAKKW